MHLLNVETLELEDFLNESQVKYAILSHRWEDGEVLYEHMAPQGRLQHLATSRHGWNKVTMCCERARRDGHKYVWVDTCCINKDSSAELQEAINSMFRWYANAQVCYAYLSDVDFGLGLEDFIKSQWFTRGWTLQELLAPKIVEFFDWDWVFLGSRDVLATSISQSTGIAQRHLSAGFVNAPVSRSEDYVCIAEIMSWAAGRKTSRPEDRAYSLLGLFDVNMPMLYGEGDKAFTRLQEQILAISNDQSLFAWRGVTPEYSSLLARSPDQFQGLPFLQDIRSCWIIRRPPSTVTNEGITAVFHVIALSPYDFRAVLNIRTSSDLEKNAHAVAIYLRRIDRDGRYVRMRWRGDDIEMHRDSRLYRFTHERRVTVVERLYYAHEGKSAYGTAIPHVTWNNERYWWLFHPFQYFKGTEIACTLEEIKEDARLTDSCLSRSEPGPLALFDCKERGAQRPFWKFMLALDYQFIPMFILFVDQEDEEDFNFLQYPLMTEFDDKDRQSLSTKLRVVHESGGKMHWFSAGILAYKPRHYDLTDGTLDIHVKGEHHELIKLCWSSEKCEHQETEGTPCWDLSILTENRDDQKFTQ